MISYAPFYKTMKAKGVTTYKLIHQYGVSTSLLDRLKHNKPISTASRTGVEPISPAAINFRVF